MHNIRGLLQICYYELTIALRQSYEIMTPLLFFIMVVCLFPLSLGPDIKTLKLIAPGIIWVAALLAILLSLSHLFREDAEKGVIDLLLLSTHSLTLLVFCKTLSHWLVLCLPLVLLCPLLGLMLSLSIHEINLLLVTLLLGTPILLLLGAIGAALTLGIQGRGLLIPILIMPFYIPVLIFATGIVLSDSPRLIHADLAWLSALLLLTLAFAPFLTAHALKNGVNQ